MIFNIENWKVLSHTKYTKQILKALLIGQLFVLNTKKSKLLWFSIQVDEANYHDSEAYYFCMQQVKAKASVY